MGYGLRTARSFWSYLWVYKLFPLITGEKVVYYYSFPAPILAQPKQSVGYKFPFFDQPEYSQEMLYNHVVDSYPDWRRIIFLFIDFL